MPRYIDADKLHYKRVWVAKTKKGAVNDAVVVFAGEIDMLALAPKTINVVNVVRCKDCIYLRKSDPLHPDTEWCQRLICGTVNPEFFCADGERRIKTDDTNTSH